MSLFTSVRGFILATLFCMYMLPGFAIAELEHSDHFYNATRLSQNGDWKSALIEYQRAVDKTPNDSLAWANLGVALGQSDMHKEALLAYEKALELKYDSAMMRFNRGISFAKLNLIDESEKEFKRAIELDPRLPRAEFSLGMIYKTQGRFDEAFALVDRLYPKNYELAKQLFEQLPPKYKASEVQNGGSVEGRVTFTGDQPKPRSFHLVHTPNLEFCSRISDGKGHRMVYDFVISPDRGLKDTIVAILGVEKGKPFPPEHKNHTFTIDRCFTPNYVIGVNNGDNFVVDNLDPVAHEIATYEIDYFDGAKQTHKADQQNIKSTPPKTSQIRSAFVNSKALQFIVRCNLHPFLETRGLMIDNPYYAVTDSEGKFKIDNIPPGTYKVLVWHPYILVIEGTVTIEPGKEAKLDINYQAENIRRTLYGDDLKGYHFQSWYDSYKMFYGGERKDDPVEVLQKYE